MDPRRNNRSISFNSILKLFRKSPVVAVPQDDRDRHTVFGASLRSHLSNTGKRYAEPIVFGCELIRNYGIRLTDVFFAPPNYPVRHQIELRFECHDPTLNIRNYVDHIQTVGCVLLDYINQLPESIFSHEPYEQFKSMYYDENVVEGLQVCVQLMPKSHRENLKYFLKFLIEYIKFSRLFESEIIFLAQKLGDCMFSGRYRAFPRRNRELVMLAFIENFVDIFYPTRVLKLRRTTKRKYRAFKIWLR